MADLVLIGHYVQAIFSLYCTLCSMKFADMIYISTKTPRATGPKDEGVYQQNHDINYYMDSP